MPAFYIIKLYGRHEDRGKVTGIKTQGVTDISAAARNM